MIKGTISFAGNLFIPGISILSDGYRYIFSSDVLKVYLAYSINFNHLNLI